MFHTSSNFCYPQGPLPARTSWPTYQVILPPRPPPPTQYYLGYAYACSLPLKAPPYLRTDKISEPPFRGLFAGFSCLGDPPKSKTLLNVPPIFYFITPFLNFSGVQRERERKTTPFLKEISGWKVKYPPFLQFSGRTLSHEKYPFTGDFGNTHAVLPTPEWGGGAGVILQWSEWIVVL